VQCQRLQIVRRFGVGSSDDQQLSDTSDVASEDCDVRQSTRGAP
jgi:hypothetical protein